MTLDTVNREQKVGRYSFGKKKVFIWEKEKIAILYT